MIVPSLPKPGAFTTDGRVYAPFRPATPVTLPAGTFSMRQDPMSGAYYLVPAASMAVPGRIYGPRHEERILKSYLHRVGQGLPTGVWLNGEKGCGKTMLAAVLSERTRAMGMPTVLVQEPFHGAEFNSVLEHLGSALVIFDEFEKVYDPKNDDASGAQEALLTVFSGTVQATHLYLVTTNDAEKVVGAMSNRPSRMLYRINYNGLPEQVVREYLAENLADQAKAEELLNILKTVPKCNFDILQNVVAEHNLHGGNVVDLLGVLNVRREGRRSYSVSSEDFVVDGKKCSVTGAWYGDLHEKVREEDHISVNLVFKLGRGKFDEKWTHIEPKGDITANDDGTLTITDRGGRKIVFTAIGGFADSWNDRF